MIFLIKDDLLLTSFWVKQRIHLPAFYPPTFRRRGNLRKVFLLSEGFFTFGEFAIYMQDKCKYSIIKAVNSIPSSFCSIGVKRRIHLDVWTVIYFILPSLQNPAPRIHFLISKTFFLSELWFSWLKVISMIYYLRFNHRSLSSSKQSKPLQPIYLLPVWTMIFLIMMIFIIYYLRFN